MSYTRALSYKGDLVQAFQDDPGLIYGPSDTTDEYWEWISADYYPDGDFTLALFRNVPRKQALQKLIYKDGEQLKKLFALKEVGLIG